MTTSPSQGHQDPIVIVHSKNASHDSFDEAGNEEEDVVVYNDEEDDENESAGLINHKTRQGVSHMRTGSSIYVPFEALDKTEIIITIISTCFVLLLIVIGVVIVYEY